MKTDITVSNRYAIYNYFVNGVTERQIVCGVTFVYILTFVSRFNTKHFSMLKTILYARAQQKVSCVCGNIFCSLISCEE